MASCIARQPIFNRHMNIYGYELLYRDAPSATAFLGGVDQNVATSETIKNSFHGVGIERVTGGKRAFVNFTEDLILEEVATLLPVRLLVVELLETVRATPAVLEACAKLHKRGYLIALDDFTFEADAMNFLKVADIVKVDFLATDMGRIRQFAHEMSNKNIKLLAEKLETQEMYKEALAMNFSLFQGYFFSHPANVDSDKELNPLKINCLQLMRLSMQENVNFTKIANIIKHDVALSYRLLRVVNSAFFGLRYTVKSIRQALAILGMDEVKKWITLVCLSELRDEKPDELITMSLIRARFLELLGDRVGLRKQADDLFMLGLLSLMDAIMDLSKEEIIRRTQVSENIANPLITGVGTFAELLRMVICYERSEWDEAIKIAQDFGLVSDDLVDLYLESVYWSNQF